MRQNRTHVDAIVHLKKGNALLPHLSGYSSRKVILYRHIRCGYSPRKINLCSISCLVIPKKGLSLQHDPSWLFPKKDSSLFTHHMCKRFLKKENFTECDISGGRSNIVEPCDFLCACVRACVRACAVFGPKIQQL